MIIQPFSLFKASRLENMEVQGSKSAQDLRVLGGGGIEQKLKTQSC